MFFMELTYAATNEKIALNMERVEVIRPEEDGGSSLFFAGDNACTRVAESLDQIRSRLPADWWGRTPSH